MSKYDHLDRDDLIRLLQRRDADAAPAAIGDPAKRAISSEPQTHAAR